MPNEVYKRNHGKWWWTELILKLAVEASENATRDGLNGFDCHSRQWVQKPTKSQFIGDLSFKCVSL